MGRNAKNARNQGRLLGITAKLHRIAVSVWKGHPVQRKIKSVKTT